MKEKTLLIFPFDLMSHYLRCITLATQYKEYKILFAGSARYNSYVTKAGYGIFDVEGFDPEIVMACAEKFSFEWLNAGDIERVFLSQCRVIKRYSPDLVIGDTCPTLKMAAEQHKVKYISLMNGYMTKYYAHTRSLSRTHPGYNHLKKLPPGLADYITNFAEKVAFRIVHKPFRQLRKKYKLKRVNNYLSEMEGDENLICDDVTFFPQTNLPVNYNIIGPLLFDSSESEEQLLQALDKKKPSICVCMGSSGNWEKLSFLSDQKFSKFNIITAGDNNIIISGEHVFNRKFINLDKVLPVCSLLICHGGNGTSYKGLEHNVYMLFITSHFEQEWNIAPIIKMKRGLIVNDNTESAISAFLDDLNINS